MDIVIQLQYILIFLVLRCVFFLRTINQNHSDMALLSSTMSFSTLQFPNFALSQPNKHLSATLYFAPPPLPRLVLCLARRRSNAGRPASIKKINKNRSRESSIKSDDVDEDAFEALFKQLEEDLKNDGQFEDDGVDEISEEDLALLEHELEEALAEDEDLSQLLNMTANVTVGGGEEKEMKNEEDDEEEEEEEDKLVNLRGWQIRRLASALKVGRRKTSIKNLTAELGLDRALVLDLLRDPPPKLLMMSATLPDKPEPAITVASSEPTPLITSEEEVTDVEEPETKTEKPIHDLQGNWSAQKRLKKVHVSTLESVYRRTKRPTNAMVSSIVQVTNLPRRKIVQWFEDKRATEGVVDQNRPYKRSFSESVFTKPN